MALIAQRSRIRAQVATASAAAPASTAVGFPVPAGNRAIRRQLRGHGRDIATGLAVPALLLAVLALRQVTPASPAQVGALSNSYASQTLEEALRDAAPVIRAASPSLALPASSAQHTTSRLAAVTAADLQQAATDLYIAGTLQASTGAGSTAAPAAAGASAAAPAAPAGPSLQDLLRAQARVATDLLVVQALQQTATDQQIAAAQAAVSQAQAALDQAQAAADTAARAAASIAVPTPDSLADGAAPGVDPLAYAAAKQRVADAQAALDRAQHPYTADEINAAKAQLASAQLALSTAQQAARPAATAAAATKPVVTAAAAAPTAAVPEAAAAPSQADQDADAANAQAASITGAASNQASAVAGGQSASADAIAGSGATDGSSGSASQQALAAAIAGSGVAPTAPAAPAVVKAPATAPTVAPAPAVAVKPVTVAAPTPVVAEGSSAGAATQGLADAVTAAQQRVADAQARVNLYSSPPDPAQVQAAQASLAQAQQALSALQVAPAAAAVTEAAAASAAPASTPASATAPASGVASAQPGDGTDAPVDPVQKATTDLQDARLQLNALTQRPDQSVVDAAESELNDAQSELAALYAQADAAVQSQIDADPTTALARIGQLNGAGLPDLQPFVWPARGPISSFFGPSHPLGIDIAQGLGLPVLAAASGTVTFSGGDPCCSYGYYVDITHPGGYMTRYGHLLTPSFLKPGDKVTQGQIIGVSGSTGNSTGPHVHFEIRFQGVPLDPLRLLAGSLPAPLAH